MHFHAFERICHPGKQCDSTDVFRFFAQQWSFDNTEEEDESDSATQIILDSGVQLIVGFGLSMETVDGNKKKYVSSEAKLSKAICCLNHHLATLPEYSLKMENYD